ncbi:response regulator transcription factor [Kangiella taiwanensis]|uniref:HTH luxR-type domain-containing protein n=1 Tax=Kangiella taiwanensis TaxID=1079179 RepID=A0ABP8HR29_9GAMM|nr:response regulator transcription factor [Kangiella taiwanensis]
MGTKTQEQSDLTSRQQEILELVSKGCSNGDIAQLLSISPNTVKTHIATILERLNVSNRTEASVFFQQHLGHQPETAVTSSNDTSPERILVELCVESSSSQLNQFSENFVQLLNAYEAIGVITNPSKDFQQDSSQVLSPDYRVKIQASAADQSKVQVVLFEASSTQRQLEKKEHESAEGNTDGLVQTVVQCYRQMLMHFVEGIEDSHASPSELLLKALALSESISFDKQDKALALCQLLIEQCPNWHLPYAIKSSLLYRMVTLGQAKNEKDVLMELAASSKTAFSINPDSSWSQLSFAYFAMLSSDLELAKKHLRASLEANPCQYKAMHFLGQVLALEGNTQEGIELYHEMLRKFPRSEADGLCYGALSLLYYCAKDYENSKQAAHRALMYQDSPKVPLLLNLISIAEIEQDQLSLSTCLTDIQRLNITPQIIQASLGVASKIVPAELMHDYLASLKRAGIAV